MLVVVEDVALAEVLAEALFEAGHVAQLVDGSDVLSDVCDCAIYDAVIVDLDTRSRNGAQVIERVRRGAPLATVIALLPCGGNAADYAAALCHVAVPKPARLAAVLAAIDAVR